MIDIGDNLQKELMTADSCIWARENKIRLIGGAEFTKEGYEYQSEIMRTSADEKVIMKCAQSGITTLFMLDAIHGLIYNQYPQGVIYYFPTEKAVEGFSKTRFGPLVSDNPAIKKYLKNTNSVSIKKVGKTFLSLLGAKATTNIQGKKDGTAVRSTPADYIIRDERDLFDEAMVRMTKDRLQNSKIGKEVDLGTPTIPDFGISKCFNESDQRYWMIPCEACNEYTCIVLEFPKSIKYREGKAYFACVKCGKEINPRAGQWVPKYPDRYVKGWQVSHFITPNIKLDKIMARWEHDQQEGKIGEFYNGVLGLPYIAVEGKLRESEVFNCCGNDVIRTIPSIRESAMGVDIGKKYHTVVIGEKTGDRSAKITHLSRIKGFEAVGDLAKLHKVKSCVICIRPYEEEFEKFRNAHSKEMRVFGSQYNPSYKQREYMKVDEKAGVYTLHKVQAFDKTNNWVRSGLLELPRRCAEVDEFARQVCNCAKVISEDERTGDRYYVYQRTGDGEDHYRSALIYFQIALGDLSWTQGSYMFAGPQKIQEYNPLNYGL